MRNANRRSVAWAFRRGRADGLISVVARQLRQQPHARTSRAGCRAVPLEAPCHNTRSDGHLVGFIAGWFTYHRQRWYIPVPPAPKLVAGLTEPVAYEVVLRGWCFNERRYRLRPTRRGVPAGTEGANAGRFSRTLRPHRLDFSIQSRRLPRASFSGREDPQARVTSPALAVQQAISRYLPQTAGFPAWTFSSAAGARSPHAASKLF